ncbi:hypothetical protein GVAV_001967 [Gurleya vavrai]
MLCKFKSLYFDFYVEIATQPSKNDKKHIQNLISLEKIDKIYKVEFYWHSKIYTINFYKIVEEHKVNDSRTIKKITVLALAKLYSYTQKFEFIYFEKIDGTILLNCDSESVQKPQYHFKNLYNNLNNFLKNFSFDNLHCNLNLFYLFFVENSLNISMNKKIFSFESDDLKIDYYELTLVIYKLFVDQFSNVIIYKQNIVNCENFNETFCLDTKCIYQNMKKSKNIIDTESHLHDKFYFYILEMNLKEQVSCYIYILPEIVTTGSHYYKDYISKEKIKNVFNSFIEKNKLSLSKDLHQKLAYEGVDKIQYYEDRRELFEFIKDDKITNLMNNLIDSINHSDIFKIFETSFWAHEIISNKFIRDFLENSKKNDNFVEINNQIVLKKSEALQNVFLFIFDQTRHELMRTLINSGKDYSLILTFDFHENYKQSVRKIEDTLKLYDLLEEQEILYKEYLDNIKFL